jgi:hypothetical protein
MMLLSALVIICNGLHFERVELTELGNLSNVSAVFSTSGQAVANRTLGPLSAKKWAT